MIEILHDLADTILGLDITRYCEEVYTLLVIPATGNYIIELYDKNSNKVLPNKIKRDNSVEYTLLEGLYKLRCYTNDKDKSEVYYEEIYVSTDLYNRSRTIKI